MFLFGFCSINVGQELGKYDLRLPLRDNSYIFLQSTVISLLSSYKQWSFEGCKSKAVHIFKVASHGCVSLGSFSGTLIGTKVYLILILGCKGSHNI